METYLDYNFPKNRLKFFDSISSPLFSRRIGTCLVRKYCAICSAKSFSVRQLVSSIVPLTHECFSVSRNSSRYHCLRFKMEVLKSARQNFCLKCAIEVFSRLIFRKLFFPFRSSWNFLAFAFKEYATAIEEDILRLQYIGRVFESFVYVSGMNRASFPEFFGQKSFFKSKKGIRHLFLIGITLNRILRCDINSL